LLTPGLVALALLLLEWLPRIAMLSTWPPIASARFSGFNKRALGFLRRGPQLPALKPLHLRVRMALLQSTQCWQEVLTFSGAKRRRESSGENRPVRKAWRHWLLLSESLEFFDERGPLDVKKFSGAISVSARAIERTLNQVTLDRREIAWQIESILREFDEWRLR